MDFWRQLDLVPMERLQKQHVHIVGAGGIGSPTAIALAKMGVGALTIWDNDLVEEHNLPNQLHKAAAVGEAKTDALWSVVEDFAPDCDLHLRQRRVDGKTRFDGIIVAAVDSMASRKTIWKAARKSVNAELLIDARMGAELLRLYTVNPLNPLTVDQYEATLYEDKDALELPCTAQSIIYTGLLAGSLVARAVKRHVAGEALNFEVILDLSSFTLLLQ